MIILWYWCVFGLSIRKKVKTCSETSYMVTSISVFLISMLKWYVALVLNMFCCLLFKSCLCVVLCSNQSIVRTIIIIKYRKKKERRKWRKKVCRNLLFIRIRYINVRVFCKRNNKYKNCWLACFVSFALLYKYNFFLHHLSFYILFFLYLTKV